MSHTKRVNVAVSQPKKVPSFVCMVDACCNPRVNYSGQLQGCTAGFHATAEDLAYDFAGLYRKMVDAITSTEPELSKPSEPCGICLSAMNPSACTPVAYMEACFHHFHPGCISRWQERSNTGNCPICRTDSAHRVLLWPELFDCDDDKGQVFRLQKYCFGLWVRPETYLRVGEIGAGDLEVVLPGGKVLILSRRVIEAEVQAHKYEWEDEIFGNPHEDFPWSETLDEDDLDFEVPDLDSFELNEQEVNNPEPESTQSKDLVRGVTMRPKDSALETCLVFDFEAARQRLEKLNLNSVEHLFGQDDKFEPQDLNSDVPEQDPVIQEQEDLQESKCCHHHRTKIDVLHERFHLLHQFMCPFAKAQEGDCSQDNCPFYHDTPGDSQVNVREFPDYFCLEYSLYEDMNICEHSCLHQQVKVRPQELARCSAGFHLTLEDLHDLDVFYCKMAKQIMDQVVPMDVPSQDPICVFCHSSNSPIADSSVWAHFENCSHCFHGDCFPVDHQSLDFDCPTCHVASPRARVWPTGHFPSESMKQWYFREQLEHFNTQLDDGTRLVVIQEKSDPNWLRIRTIDRELRFNEEEIEDEQEIWMDEITSEDDEE